MTQKKVINIVNFVRALDPRIAHSELVRCTEEEIRLNKRYQFPNTFLLQYDAMIDPEFQDLFRRERDAQMELGVWIELSRPLTEAVGIPWRGRAGYDWDWHVDSGFLMGYAPDARKRLIDEIMRKFRELFGTYPKSVGSWLLDSVSMTYLSETYHTDAFLICREQYAIDAYTLWGGYFNQGYYPAKTNMLCPAQHAETQIATPVFRRLGPDPIYGYDEKAELYPQAHPSCNTLEPVWFTGRDPDAIDWLLDCYYGQECMNFAYATAGQENSFGWTDVQAGLETQFEKIQKLVNDGKLTVETLGDTGRWFRRTFDRTPATALTALSDREQNDIRSVWYDCQNYRASVQLQGDRLYFLDIYRFDDAYRERYLTEACKEWQATYDNLPVIDGRLWSTPGTTARLELDVPVQSIDVQRTGENTLTVTALTADGESIHIDFAESGFTIHSAQPHCWTFRRGQDHGTTLTAEPHALHLTHNGFDYTVPVVGALTPRDGGYDLATEHEEIAFRLAGTTE